MKNNKKGVTLVEVLIALAVMGIVSALASIITSNVSSQMVRTSDVTRAQRAINTMQIFLEDEIRYVDKITISHNTSETDVPSGMNVIYSRNGKFWTNFNGTEKEFFKTLGSDENIYENLDFSIEFKAENGETLVCVISASNKNSGDAVYSQELALNSLNLAADIVTSGSSPYTAVWY